MSIGKTVESLELLTIKGYRKVCYPLYSFLDSIRVNPFQCRYTPSCSQYAEEAIREWGAYKGAVMAFKRIVRCNPYGGYGHDPVPKKQDPM